MMSKKTIIWCSHPKHDEILPDGKKKFRKTGLKPSHPKGKRIVSKDLIKFLNGYDERIVNGVSKTLVEGDYFCTICFDKENSNLIAYKRENRLNITYVMLGHIAHITINHLYHQETIVA